jgi:hypothetical protein
MNGGGVGQEEAGLLDRRRRVWRGALADRVQPGVQISAASQDYHIALVRAFRGAARSGRPLASCTKLSVMAKTGVPETRSPTPPLTGVGRGSYFGGFHHSMVASEPSMRLRKSF